MLIQKTIIVSRWCFPSLSAWGWTQTFDGSVDGNNLRPQTRMSETPRVPWDISVSRTTAHHPQIIKDSITPLSLGTADKHTHNTGRKISKLRSMAPPKWINSRIINRWQREAALQNVSRRWPYIKRRYKNACVPWAKPQAPEAVE